MIGVASETEEIFRGSRVLMVTQQAFYQGEFDLPSSILFPLVGSGVSAGFPSPADDYIETSIDLNRELVRHPFATFFRPRFRRFDGRRRHQAERDACC